MAENGHGNGVGSVSGARGANGVHTAIATDGGEIRVGTYGGCIHCSASGDVVIVGTGIDTISFPVI